MKLYIVETTGNTTHYIVASDWNEVQSKFNTEQTRADRGWMYIKSIQFICSFDPDSLNVQKLIL